MLARLFGRRKPAPVLPPHPGADADGVARVFPKELFEGENGAFLREMGFSPDAPANILPTQSSVQARSEAVQRELDVMVASVNNELGGTREVVPWAMVPWSVWNREPAAFMLVTCEFYPASRWNTMLLPANAETAEALGLPQHPRGAIEGLEDAAARVFTELSQQHEAKLAKVSAALGRGQTSALAEADRGRDEVRAQAAGIARHFGHAVFGGDVADRHEHLFGEILWSKV